MSDDNIKLLSLSFLYQLVLALFFIAASGKYVSDIDMGVIIGMGSLFISLTSYSLAVLTIWVLEKYKQYKEHKDGENVD